MEKARRRRVPAFGEWNYYDDEPETTEAPPPAVVAAAWYATPVPEVCSDVWFRYSPPPRKPTPPKKQSTRRPGGGDASREHQRARPSLNAAAAAKSGVSRRVVRPVDEDLYQVPPPELVGSRRRPGKKRSLWMGCCLGCVA